uniref:hypothetical protein n=1 Tax=Alistipes shahii TaxID=328814 RepID=UPI0040385174
RSVISRAVPPAAEITSHPSPSLGITALRDFLGGSAKAGKTGAGLKRNGPRLGNEFPAGPDAF